MCLFLMCKREQVQGFKGIEHGQCVKARAELSHAKLGAEGGGFLESGLEDGGDGFFCDGEAIDAYGEARPFRAFECKEEFVDITETVLAAGESGLNGLGDRERVKGFGDGLIQQCVGDGKNAHEKEIRFFLVHFSELGKLFAEEGTGQGSAHEFGRFAGS